MTCSESRTFSFQLCRNTVSLMSMCFMTPCLHSCSHSCLLSRVSLNHNVKGWWTFASNVLMLIQAIVYKHFIRTQITKILVAMPPALPVPCWLLLSVPYARNCRIHRRDEEPQKATQVFRIDQLCLNGREAAFLGSSLKMFSWLVIAWCLSKNAFLSRV